MNMYRAAGYRGTCWRPDRSGILSLPTLQPPHRLPILPAPLPRKSACRAAAMRPRRAG